MKVCSRCGLPKPLDQFGPARNRDGRESRCRECRAREARRDYAEKPERRQYHRDYAARPERRAATDQWHREHSSPRITPDQFIESVDRRILYTMHGGMCGICEEFIQGDFHVDHVIPLSKGGLHCYANVQPAHLLCNLEKAAK